MSAQAVIRYYPDPNGSLESINFGTAEVLDDTQDFPSRDSNEAQGLNGDVFGVPLTGALDVSLLLENFSGVPLSHKLKSLESHLQRYGVFSFCRNEDIAFGAWCVTLPQRGDTTLSHGGHVFWGSPTISAGDWLVLESPLPEMTREWVLVASTSGNVITLDATTPVVYTYTLGPVLIRERDFHPALLWPKAYRRGQMVTHDRRLAYTFEGTFRQGPLAALYGIGGTVVRTADAPGKPTLDSLTVQRGYGRTNAASSVLGRGRSR